MAEVLSLAAGRQRFAQRVDERARRNLEWNEREERQCRVEIEEQSRQREEHARQAAERWLSDLKTWPAAFQRRLQPSVVHHTDKDSINCRLTEQVTIWEARRAGDPDGFYLPFPDRLKWELAHLRDAIRRYRETDTPRRRKTTCAALRAAQESLLLMMWSFGVRKVERETLQPLVLEELDGKTHSIEARLQELPDHIADLEAKVRSGVVPRGAKAGRRYKESSIQAMSGRLSGLQDERSSLQRKLRAIQGEPDRVQTGPSTASESRYARSRTATRSIPPTTRINAS